MTDTFRVAIAGCHRMLDRRRAGHNWAAGFAADPRTEIVAVFDKGAETRQRFVETWGSMPAFDDFGAMIDHVQPDVVCVTTRQTMHADQIERASAAGVKGILCEKPLATSMEEVDRIVAACARHGIKFTFGLDRRWYPFYRKLAPALGDGLIGNVQTIAAYGNMSLVFLGCHWFDRVLDLAGDPEVAWVSGTVDSVADEPPDSRKRIDPTGSCQIQLANGVEAYVTARGGMLGLDVHGTQGRVVILADGAEAHLWTTGDDGKTLIERDYPKSEAVEAWPIAVGELFDAIERDGDTIANVQVARRATEISFAVHESHRQGGRRVTPAEIDRSLRIESYPWGNE